MNIRIQVLIVAAAVLIMLYIVNKVRKKGIELRYSLLWLLLDAGIIVFACFPQVTSWLAHVLGIKQPVNMLFFAGFSLSASVSRLSDKAKRMSQEIALLNKEIERIANERKDEDMREDC